ncbi:hypothetical protein ACS0TY_004319 [Phlomoides rotata]
MGVKDVPKLISDLDAHWIGPRKFRAVEANPIKTTSPTKSVVGKRSFPIKNSGWIDGMSFIQVIKGVNDPPVTQFERSSSPTECIVCTSNEEDLEWSKRFVVGDFSKDWIIEDIRLEFIKEGFYNFSFESMGNNRSWCDLDVIKICKSWLSIFGVPLHGWNVDTFTSIGNKLGKTIKVDKDTANKSDLSQGWVLIKSWQWERFNKKMTIEINKKRYSIWVTEGGEFRSATNIPELIDSSDSGEASSESDSLDLEEDEENHDTLSNSNLYYNQKETLVHRRIDDRVGNNEKSLSGESSNAWVVSLAAHEDLGTDKDGFPKDSRIEKPLDDSSTIKDSLEGPTKADNGNFISNRDLNNFLIKGGVSKTPSSLEGCVSATPYSELKDQVKAQLDLLGLIITKAQAANNSEAQFESNSTGPSRASSPKSVEEIDSDPFALAPYIEEAFLKKKEAHRKKIAKFESNKEKLLNKKKAWEEFLTGMDSKEERNCPIRKGKKNREKLINARKVIQILAIQYQRERWGGPHPLAATSSDATNLIGDEVMLKKQSRRKFTWYKDNGTCCSRIDRFLVSNNLCSMWPNLKQSGLKRTFSDHAPILLEASNKVDWGPIPFKIVNWWIDQKDFRILVDNTWKNSKVVGWGGYILIEKLKSVKFAIKNWKKVNGT